VFVPFGNPLAPIYNPAANIWQWRVSPNRGRIRISLENVSGYYYLAGCEVALSGSIHVSFSSVVRGLGGDSLCHGLK
jgi:hypothetical protein